MLKISRAALSSKKLKVLVVGSAACGKSCLIQRAITGKFDEGEYVPTLGAELFLKDESHDNEKTTIYMWSCGGDPRFRPIIQLQYENIKGVVLVYDMTNDKSFKELLYWHNEFLRVAPDVTMVLVGCKSDLSEKIKIAAEDGIKQAKEWGISHIATSAKTGTNVDQIFSSLLNVTSVSSSSSSFSSYSSTSSSSAFSSSSSLSSSSSSSLSSSSLSSSSLSSFSSSSYSSSKS
eukprot:TRINITY_DN318_c0_g1_i1.p1 TRINITY_DN318_c0_g1~~TRINITY_DN318_c0_g1_i1.p1  ORF type:complete len:233 (-),score=94.05 TRINITY_DN318_c0_g1_i1:150-848(-)